jgi:methionine-rich copper-binding protein CopC
MKATALILAAGLLTALGAAVPAAPGDAFHFALRRSEPAADATVRSPAQIRLWFTQAAQENSMGIRLLDAGGTPVETSAPVPVEGEAAAYSVAVGKVLAGGAYTVSWRGIGDDGHVVRGDFTFTVSAQ